MTVAYADVSFNALLEDVTVGVTRESLRDIQKVKSQFRKRNGRGFKSGKTYVNELRRYSGAQLKQEYLDIYAHVESDGPYEEYVPGCENLFALYLIRRVFQDRYK